MNFGKDAAPTPESDYVLGAKADPLDTGIAVVTRRLERELAEEQQRGLQLLADVKDYQAENVRIRSELAERDAEIAKDSARWQKLRDLFGLDGWHDGHYNGVATPDQIVTHIEHVARERARLLHLTMQQDAEIARLREDAKRYRWIRQGEHGQPRTRLMQYHHDIHLDRAIDAARKEGE